MTQDLDGTTHQAPLFAALGDSFTEGMHDEFEPGGRHRGWADRVARTLAARHGALRYANLAVRGRLVGEVVTEQVPVAVDLAPDLVSFHAGGNDLLRPGKDIDTVAASYEDGVARLAAAIETVVLFTVLERAGGTGPVADRLAARFAGFNARIRAIAAHHGAVLVDVGAVPALHDRRLWHEDRLHLNALGHARVAAAFLEVLARHRGEPVAATAGWWRQPMTSAAPAPPLERVAGDARWLRRHLAPWLWRRLRRISSGDGIVAKHPVPIVVVPPAARPTGARSADG